MDAAFGGCRGDNPMQHDSEWAGCESQGQMPWAPLYTHWVWERSSLAVLNHTLSKRFDIASK